MIELPEAAVIAGQINRKVNGRKIKKVIAAHSPHKFAWYQGNPKDYPSLLKDKIIQNAASAGGVIEIKSESTVIALSDGAGLRYHDGDKSLPSKHQLLIELDDSSFLTVSIQMYGGILCFKEGGCDNKYYLVSKERPSPLTKDFTVKYFDKIISLPDLQNKSVKFFLATEQRIPGLGNGVLQDILFDAKIHPKRKVEDLSEKEKEGLFISVKNVLREMFEKGGRDTEKDLFGNSGGYAAKLSKNTAGKSCGLCGSLIVKENYMGGSIYYCGKCQKLF